MKKKKILSAILAGLMSLSVTFGVQAATRDEISAIKVSKSGKFNYWTKDSAAKQKLIAYVKDVTNKNSKNFIPVEDRIAVFDCDGTLMCETAPFYFDWMLPIYRVLKDPNYNATSAEKSKAIEFRNGIDTNTVTDDMDDEKSKLFAKIFSGMTPEEYQKYVTHFMNSESVEGLSNLKIGEAFYLPMVEIVSYLNANNFTVYIVSGCEREALRALIKDTIHIKPNHIIGTDHSYTTMNLGNNRADRFFFKGNDELQRGNKIIDVNVQATKIFKIQREIGKKPVLAFGNSMGDGGMFNFTINDNKYKSLAFVLLCDDTGREFGNISKAEKMKQTAAENNWITVSMRDDWTTIYGDDVKREK